jgi:hypothetical protein
MRLLLSLMLALSVTIAWQTSALAGDANPSGGQNTAQAESKGDDAPNAAKGEGAQPKKQTTDEPDCE